MPFPRTRTSPRYLFTVLSLLNQVASTPVKYGDYIWLRSSEGVGGESWTDGSVLSARLSAAPKLSVAPASLNNTVTHKIARRANALAGKSPAHGGAAAAGAAGLGVVDDPFASTTTSANTTPQAVAAAGAATGSLAVAGGEGTSGGGGGGASGTRRATASSSASTPTAAQSHHRKRGGRHGKNGAIGTVQPTKAFVPRPGEDLLVGPPTHLNPTGG